MKKILILCTLLLIIQNARAVPDTLTVMNLTNNFTLYYQVIASEDSCYPRISSYDTTNGSGYFEMAAGDVISFYDYIGLNTYYPNFKVYYELTAAGTPQGPILGTTANSLLLAPIFNMNWASIIYKVESANNAEGGWIGFADFYTCHGLPSSWGNPPTTDTYGFTSFTIGNDRYFIS